MSYFRLHKIMIPLNLVIVMFFISMVALSCGGGGGGGTTGSGGGGGTTGGEESDSKVRIKIIPFGRGTVTSDIGSVDYDSERTVDENTFESFFPQSPDQTVTLTASPHPLTKILGWHGCADISTDQTQCIVDTKKDHDIQVSFGYTETEIVSNLVDLSRAVVHREGYTLYVVVEHGDQDLIAKMVGLMEGDFVVGFASGGFLLKVSTMERISDYRYTLTTQEATLEDVILQGTGVLKKQLAHEDLIGDTSTVMNILSETRTQQNYQTSYTDLTDLTLSATPGSPSPSEIGFKSAPGVYLKPSKGREDKVFTILLGSEEPQVFDPLLLQIQDTFWERNYGVILHDENGIKVTVSGRIDVEIFVDIGVSYGLFGGLEDFKFVPTIKTTQNLTLDVTGDINHSWYPDPIISMPFGHLKFFIGPVPVWIEFHIDVSIGAEADLQAQVNTSIDLEQKAMAGISYSKNSTGFMAVKDIQKSWIFNEPVHEFEMYGKVFIKPSAGILFYSVTGPAIDIEPYLELEGFSSSEVVNYCDGGVHFESHFGLKSDFRWDCSGDTKIGRLLHLDELEDLLTFSIIPDRKWKISNWNFGGVCGILPPRLQVIGPHIFASTIFGEGEFVSQEYTLKNVGGQNLDWSISGFFGLPLNAFVSQSEGMLRPGQSIFVEITFDTIGLKIGDHRKAIFFNNDSVSDLLNKIGGYRFASITVLPPYIPAPVLNEPTLFSPTIVQLSWQHPSGPHAEYVSGYWVFYSTDLDIDLDIWNHVATIVDPLKTNHLVSHLITDQNYYFRVIAYGENYLKSDPSSTIQIYLPPIIPEDRCRAHFSGALMADRFQMNWLSEVYVLDQYSEYVGAGRYPDNHAAFPKAIATTFDGVAIDAGTKVTIYSQPNFQGTILWEQQGPAIINNHKWINTFAYDIVMGIWKEPLQSTYPQSVREWSYSDMHAWRHGSTIVECGY